MELKDNGVIKLDKGKQKIKCYKFFEKDLNRNLMLHVDVDNKNHISISDERTGIRLTGLNISINKIKMEQVNEELDRWKKHFTLPSIREEFLKYEDI